MDQPPSQTTGVPTFDFPARAVAGCFALACFAVAVFSGLAAERPFNEVVLAGLAALVLGNLLGFAAGAVIGAALRESFTDYARRRPVPSYEPPERTPSTTRSAAS